MYVGVIILIISYIILKYFQFKSLKYLKEEYEFLKRNLLFFQATFPPKKYYADIEGIKLRNKGALFFLFGGIIAFLYVFIYYLFIKS